MRTSGERLRQEGRDQMRAVAEQRHREGRSEGRLETIDGFLRTGVGWSVIERATGIDETQYRKLTEERRNGGSLDGDGPAAIDAGETGHAAGRPAWLRRTPARTTGPRSSPPRPVAGGCSTNGR